MKILHKMTRYFSCIEFNEDDIVRSGLVKDFIIKKTHIENNARVPVNATKYFNDSQVVHAPPPRDP